LDAARAWRVAPVAVAAAIALAYVLVEPRTVDLAASVYRSDLFGDVGFSVWNGNWYAGHHTPSYSVLFPPLGWLLGPVLAGALAAVLAAALFEPLARRHFGVLGARVGALWFALGVAAQLLSGRVPFVAGVAAGVAALLALQRGRVALACVLAVVSALLSPVAGLFLALLGVTLGVARIIERPAMPAIAGSPGRSVGKAAAFTLAALLPPAFLSLAFPDGRQGPFVFSAFWPLPLLALGFAAAVPKRERALRIGALLYALAGTAAYVVDTPLGGNAVRLGALAGGPLLAAALLAAPGRQPRGARGAAIALLLAGFAAWQWSPAIRDVSQTWGDRSTEASFYRPLLGFLDRHPGAYRVEIPFTFSHWETAEVARDHPLARGWLRPDDIDYNAIFYAGPLTAATYRQWLTEHGVRYVAVARAKPDYSARDELRLIASGLPYLRPAFAGNDWRVYEVTAPHPLSVPQTAITVTRLGRDDVTLHAGGPASAVVRVRWTPYWRVDGGCVERAGDWTRVTARRTGTLRLRTDFSLGRVLDHGRRCS
jgi:hypothetical protein